MSPEYHTLSPSLRNNMTAAKHAALQIDRANCGAFATDRAVEQARSAASDLIRLGALILEGLPPEPNETPARKVLRFRGAA